VSDAATWSLGLARWASELGRDLQRPIRAAGGPDRLWRADAGTLAAVLRIGAPDAARLVALRGGFRPGRILAGLAATGMGHVHPGEPRWPVALAELPDPPVGLFGRGPLDAVLGSLRDAPVVAMVGSRRATAQGRALAHAVAGDLARAGAVVVSGLAHGIDAAAHEGALAEGGVTIAVLGCGVDVSYPRRHRDLAERIAERGALLSEFWPGTPPAPWRFPARNRIVAGLAGAVVVVEAGERSGALITADFALEVGRPVLAVPGWPGAAASVGCNALLRAGAALMEGAQDIIAELPDAPWRRPEHARVPDPLDGLAARAIACLAHEPLPADALAGRLGEDAASVACALALLEVDGRVARGDGQRYMVLPRPGA
jgi:DNA processing protein